MLSAALASVTDVCAPRPASQHCPALPCATETMSAMVTQQLQLHSWPISRVLARSAAGDSQLVVAKQPEQFGAAIQAARGMRWLGVMLCTCGRGRRLGPKSALPAPCMRLYNLMYRCQRTGPVLISVQSHPWATCPGQEAAHGGRRGICKHRGQNSDRDVRF